jgi:hypothetical protein
MSRYSRLLLSGLLAFGLLALIQQIHRFHSERLRAVSPNGAVIWRAGMLRSDESETLTFTRAVEAGRRSEMRLFAWSLSGGRLELNGAPLGDLPPDKVAFFYIQHDKMKPVDTFSASIPSVKGMGAFWLSEMSGFGTDASWTCTRDGKALPVRVWGWPPLYPWKALEK